MRGNAKDSSVVSSETNFNGASECDEVTEIL